MAEQEATVDKSEERIQRAILFEMENLAIQGREACFDALKAVLGDQGLKVTPLVYSKYFLGKSLARGLSNFLKSTDHKDVSQDQLLEKLSERIKKSLAGKSKGLDKGLKAVLDAVSREGVLIGALSSVDEESMDQLGEALGLKDMGVRLQSFSTAGAGSPAADEWLTLAKRLKVSPSSCLAVVTDSVSCRAALSAGMKCLARPDRLSAFQDFGGADCVAETLDSAMVDDVLELLELGQ